MRNLITNGIKRLVNNESEYPRGDRNARILAIATVKGGVGKTTTAVNVATGLAKFEDAKVLLVDLDAQGHCSTSLSSRMPRTVEKTPLSQVLLSDERVEVLDAVVPAGIENLDVTPADTELAEADGRISQKIGKEALLRDALEVTRTHYDYIIVDCPPNKGNLTVNGLVAADKVLIPTDLSPLSVQGADELLGTIATVNDRLDRNLDVLGVVLTRVDGRTRSINDSVYEQIEDAWQDLLLDTHIGINTALSKAQLSGKPIFEYDDNSRGAEHYRALTDEIARKL